ncbi:MAG: hypothetical protein DMF67_00245 [Acidobacteria bacterium]|nr:MAG: hypothetical protein DMF67_00245 [Acidobacteriota bacterium]
MSAILIISVFLIFVASLALLRTKRPRSNEEAEQLPPRFGSRGLFGGDALGSPGGGSNDDAEPEKNASEELEKTLCARAERGDFEALKDAHAGGVELYRRILDALVERCANSPEDLRALAALLAGSDELRSSPALAERLLEVWRQSPARPATAELLRVAALSDDAETFGLAVSTVLRAWEDGRLGDTGAEELRSLFEGEYWLLSSEAKRSGAGFLLKQKLADARHRLAARARRENPPSTGAFRDELPAQKERP